MGVYVWLPRHPLVFVPSGVSFITFCHIILHICKIFVVLYNTALGYFIRADCICIRALTVGALADEQEIHESTKRFLQEAAVSACVVLWQTRNGRSAPCDGLWNVDPAVARNQLCHVLCPVGRHLFSGWHRTLAGTGCRKLDA